MMQFSIGTVPAITPDSPLASFYVRSNELSYREGFLRYEKIITHLKLIGAMLGTGLILTAFCLPALSIAFTALQLSGLGVYLLTATACSLLKKPDEPQAEIAVVSRKSSCVIQDLSSLEPLVDKRKIYLQMLLNNHVCVLIDLVKEGNPGAIDLGSFTQEGAEVEFFHLKLQEAREPAPPPLLSQRAYLLGYGQKTVKEAEPSYPYNRKIAHLQTDLFQRSFGLNNLGDLVMRMEQLLPPPHTGARYMICHQREPQWAALLQIAFELYKVRKEGTMQEALLSQLMENYSHDPLEQKQHKILLAFDQLLRSCFRPPSQELLRAIDTHIGLVRGQALEKQNRLREMNYCLGDGTKGERQVNLLLLVLYVQEGGKESWELLLQLIENRNLFEYFKTIVEGIKTLCELPDSSDRASGLRILSHFKESFEKTRFSKSIDGEILEKTKELLASREGEARS